MFNMSRYQELERFIGQYEFSGLPIAKEIRKQKLYIEFLVNLSETEVKEITNCLTNHPIQRHKFIFAVKEEKRKQEKHYNYHHNLNQHHYGPHHEMPNELRSSNSRHNPLSNSSNKTIVKTGNCPVCREKLNSEESITWCTDCNNAVHLQCFKECAKNSEQVLCMFCKHIWKNHYVITKDTTLSQK
eukprot:UN07409